MEAIAGTSMNAFSSELFINFRVSFHLRVKSAEVLTLNSVSGNSSTAFGGTYVRPSAAHSSVNSVSGNSSTTFGGAYMRPSAAHSSVNSVSGNSSTTFGGAYARPPVTYFLSLLVDLGIIVTPL